MPTDRSSKIIERIIKIDKRRFLIFIFILSFIVRILFIFIHEDFKLLNEMGGYVLAAANLIEGNGFLFSHERDYRAFLPPLYSVYLAFVFLLFGKNFIVVRIIQSLLGALSVLMTYSVGKKMGNEKIARLAAMTMTIYPQNIVFADLILTETLFLFLFLISFLFLFKGLEAGSYFYACLAGVFFGLSSLTRSISFYFLFFLCVICLISRRGRSSLRYIVATTLLMCLTVLPWTVRNYIIRDTFILINSKTAIDFYMYNHSDFYHILKNRPDIEDEKAMDAMGTDEVTIYRNATRLTYRWIREHPFLFLFKGVRMMWNFGSIERTFFTHLKGDYYGEIPEILKILLLPFLILPFMVLMPLIVIGILYIPKDRMSVLIPIYLVYYFMIVGFVANIFYRQRYPLLPFFVVFASYGLLHIKDILPEFIPSWKEGNAVGQNLRDILKGLPGSFKGATWKARLSLFLIVFFSFGWLLDITLSFGTIVQHIFR